MQQLKKLHHEKFCNDFIQKWATSLIEMVQIVLYIKVLE